MDISSAELADKWQWNLLSPKFKKGEWGKSVWRNHDFCLTPFVCIDWNPFKKPIWKKKFNLIATAAAGLEAVVGREIRELGFDCQVENGRVRFEGDVSTIIQTNLWLRAADRIKIVVGSFPAKTFEALFQGVFALDWENYLPLGVKFPISKAKCVKSKLHNEPSVQAISKKAVVKKLQKHYARPEGVPLQENGAEFKIEVSILKDVATVMIDTTAPASSNVVIGLIKAVHRSRKYGSGHFTSVQLVSR